VERVIAHWFSLTASVRPDLFAAIYRRNVLLYILTHYISSHFSPSTPRNVSQPTMTSMTLYILYPERLDTQTWGKNALKNPVCRYRFSADSELIQNTHARCGNSPLFKKLTSKWQTRCVCVCVCVCVWVRERERERECVSCVREGECVCVCANDIPCMCIGRRKDSEATAGVNMNNKRI